VKTDTGKVRAKNEDSSGVFPEAAFFIVADGMGGHVGGERASALAVETMHGVLQETQGEDLTPITTQNGWSSVAGRRLFLAIQRANNEVFEMSQRDPNLNGMGTTVAAVLFDEQESVAGICHVGDSRVYRIRDGVIERLTEDHSLVQQLLKEGKIGDEDMLRVIQQTTPNLEKACDTLVNLANERGGRDNSTIILLSYVEDPTVTN
jgi:protein phosphatase